MIWSNVKLPLLRTITVVLIRLLLLQFLASSIGHITKAQPYPPYWSNQRATTTNHYYHPHAHRSPRSLLASVREPSALHTRQDDAVGSSFNRAAVNQPNVRIQFRVTSSRKGEVTCLIDSGDSHDTSLYSAMLICPQVSTTICYRNCKPTCSSTGSECLVPTSLSRVVESCSYNRSRINERQQRLKFTWLVNLERIDRSGQWNCDYRGRRAERGLELQAATNDLDTAADVDRGVRDQPPTRRWSEASTTTTTNSLQVKESQKITADHKAETERGGGVVDARLDGIPSSSDRRHQLLADTTSNGDRSSSKAPLKTTDSKSTSRSNDDEDNVSSRKIVFTLLGFLLVSIIFNVILAIRCILFKNYVDSFRHGKPNKLLARLLCFRLTNKSVDKTSRDSMSASYIKHGNGFNYLPTSCMTGNPNGLVYYPNPGGSPQLDAAQLNRQPSSACNYTNHSGEDQCYHQAHQSPSDRWHPPNLYSTPHNAMSDSVTNSIVLTNASSEHGSPTPVMLLAAPPTSATHDHWTQSPVDAKGCDQGGMIAVRLASGQSGGYLCCNKSPPVNGTAATNSLPRSSRSKPPRRSNSARSRRFNRPFIIATTTGQPIRFPASPHQHQQYIGAFRNCAGTTASSSLAATISDDAESVTGNRCRQRDNLDNLGRMTPTQNVCLYQQQVQQPPTGGHLCYELASLQAPVMQQSIHHQHHHLRQQYGVVGSGTTPTDNSIASIDRSLLSSGSEACDQAPVHPIAREGGNPQSGSSEKFNSNDINVTDNRAPTSDGYGSQH